MIGSMHRIYIVIILSIWAIFVWWYPIVVLGITVVAQAVLIRHLSTLRNRDNEQEYDSY